MRYKNLILIENLLLIFLSVFFIWLALRTYFYLPYTDNEGAFVLFGREMGRGARLYTDIWDHKPPFLFGQSWLLQFVFSLTDFHLHLYGFFIHGLNAFLIFHLAKRMNFSRLGSWVSVLTYTILLFPPLFQTWVVDADLLLQPFLIFSFWAAFSKKSWIIFLSGFFWTVAFLTKQSALFILPVYLMSGVFAEIRKILKWLGGAFLAFVMVAFYFAFYGRWMDFNMALIGFNQIYIQIGWLFFFSTPAFRSFLVRWFEVAGLSYGLFFLTLGLGAIGKSLKSVHPRTVWLLVVWFLVTLVSCMVSGYFFSYYYISLLPVLALGMGLVCMKFQYTKRKDLMICLIAIGVQVVILGMNGFGLRDKIFSYAQYSCPRYFADKAIGLFIASKAKPNDELLSWSDDPQIYVYSGLKPSIKTPFVNHLAGMPYDSWKIYKNFLENPPHYCVICRMDQVMMPPKWLKTQIKKYYVKVKTVGDLDLYQIR